MPGPDALSQQQFATATAAVHRLVSEDPSTYWRVSPPQSGAHVERLRGGFAAYRLRGGRSTRADKVDIGGLVAEPGAKGIARQAMQKADEKFPTRRQTLDAFDGRLPQIYSHFGFKETGRIPFDEKYAPPGWKPEFGKPDVVFMERGPHQPALFDMQRTRRQVGHPQAVAQGVADARRDEGRQTRLF